METVNIKIDLKIITHEGVNEHPYVNICLNGSSYFAQFCETSTLVEFDIEVEDDTENFLTIEYTNKNPKQDVVIQNNEIIQDKRIEINTISFDDIELDFFELEDIEKFSYKSTDEEIETTGFDASKLSWNGKTTLKFTTPVYIWLLENL